jgi:phage terminase large subunit-like protein
MRPSSSSTLKSYASLTDAQQVAILAKVAAETGLAPRELQAILVSDWRIVGRPSQQPPPGDWTYWFLRCGRGFGKTLTGAQWTKTKALERPRTRIALVAPTFGDARDTMVEGETGLLSLLHDRDLRGGSRSSAWNRGTGELYFANRSKAQIFSSEKPDRLRGPQHHAAWCEEVSSWRDANRGDALETTWSNVKLGLRLGFHPQAIITSTPKANKLTKALIALPRDLLVMTTGSSYENRDNLAEAWWRDVVVPYEGTRLGRQEIHAEILEDVEGALWTLAMLDRLRVAHAPEMSRVVVAVDPNTSSDDTADDAGIVVCGRGAYDRFGYVLADETVTRGGPAVWAARAVDAFYEYQADRIVAEKNNGGEMVKLVIKQVDDAVPVKLVVATRGKRTRAEPIAALYESVAEGPTRTAKDPAVRHVGTFPDLEDEMTTWTEGMASPNRLDALVWGLWELMVKQRLGRAHTSMPRGRIPGVGRSAYTGM